MQKPMVSFVRGPYMEAADHSSLFGYCIKTKLSEGFARLLWQCECGVLCGRQGASVPAPVVRV